MTSNSAKALRYTLLLALAAFIAWKLYTSHFDWHGFARSFRSASLPLVFLAIAVILVNYVLRALRWAIFLRPAFRQAGLAPTPWHRLIGPQFIGFTGLALFGRLGELIRPLLTARRTGLSFSSQVAVVAVERIFDLGAFALFFSLNLLLSPSLATLPYHQKFHAVGYAIAALTAALILFVLAVRLAGTRVAALAASLTARISPSAAPRVSVRVQARLLEFRDGLNVLDSFASFLQVAALSLLLWAVIALSYFTLLRAYPAPVHALTLADTLVLMGFSVVGSLVQLPGVGGGAQVGTISALTLLFSIPREQAVSAGLMLWLVTTMSVIPIGLLYARIEGVNLRQAATRSEDTLEAEA